MEYRKFKFGAFTSSNSSSEYLREFSHKKFEDVDLKIFDEGLEEAIPLGKAMADEGIEVIISRRGTASLLRENVHIPVISLPLTSMDIFMSAKKASAFGRRILLPSFRTKMGGLDILEELLGIELIQLIYHDSKSLERLISQESKQRCDVAIGGGVTKRLGLIHNLPVVEIEVSEEEVYSTIENAKSVAQSNRDQQEKAELYGQIIDSISDGIIAFNRNGEITTINKMAKNLFKISEQNISINKVSKHLSPSIIKNVLEKQRPILNKAVVIKRTQHIFNHIPIIMGSETIGVVSTFRGITDIMKAEKALRRSLTRGLFAKYVIKDLIYRTSIMKGVVNKAKRFAQTDGTILITGETGTGKEILAQSIHNLSQRQKGPFVSINCASLPDQLIESELFGYDQGAFTGAIREGKPGLFEIAHTGTIFLDEVAATSESAQTSLLRILEEKEVRRIGADRLIPIDVRVIAAANKDLPAEVQCGRFRDDLFFRLNVLHIHIPPLRERASDIPLLVDYFVQQISQTHHLYPLTIPKSYLSKLAEYEWPGNVRQLRSFVEQLILLCNGAFDPDTFYALTTELIPENPEAKKIHGETNLVDLQEKIEHQRIENENQLLWQALRQTNFNKAETAKLMGISRTTLWRRLKDAKIP